MSRDKLRDPPIFELAGFLARDGFMEGRLIKLELEVVPLRPQVSSRLFAEDVASAYRRYLQRQGCLAEFAATEEKEPKTLRLRIKGPESVVVAFSRAEAAVVHKSRGPHPYLYEEDGKATVVAMTCLTLGQADAKDPPRFRLYDFEADQIEQVILYRRRRVRCIGAALRYGRLDAFSCR